MIRNVFEFKIVPFSAATIRKHRLHLTSSDGIASSSILYVLNNEIAARLPESMIVCSDRGKPIGVGLVFVLVPGDGILSYDPTHDQERHGFLNIYVTREYRHQGIGTALFELAIENFKKTYPGIERVIMHGIFRGKSGKYGGIEPVYSRLGTDGPVLLLHRLVRRSVVYGLSSSQS